MQLFAVLGLEETEQGKVLNLAKTTYANENIYTLEHGFIVASSGETTQEVAQKLGIGDDTNNYIGVVIQTSFYWGYHSRALWEWMNARAKGNGD